MSPACVVPTTRPPPRPGLAGTSHFPGWSSPAQGGRGERALRSFCLANRKLPRGEKANSVSLGSAVSQRRLMCGEAGRREPQGGGSSEGAGIRRGARRGTTSGPLAWGPSWLPSPPQVHSPLGSFLSFHLPLIPLEAGLTQEHPKQGPKQCHTPARTPLTVATWGFTPFTPLDTSPWAEPTGGNTRRSKASLRGAECHPSSQTQSLVEGGQDGPGSQGSGSGVWEVRSERALLTLSSW